MGNMFLVYNALLLMICLVGSLFLIHTQLGMVHNIMETKELKKEIDEAVEEVINGFKKICLISNKMDENKPEPSEYISQLNYLDFKMRILEGSINSNLETIKG